MNILILSYLLTLIGSYSHAGTKSWSLAVKNDPKRLKPISKHAHTFLDLIRRSDIFIDKTFILTRLLQIRRYDKVVLSLPRMWGKSVNLHMLKTFLEIQTDKFGTRLPLQSTSNYKLFRHGEIRHTNGEVETLKEPFLILNRLPIVERYQGKFPVILVSFRGVHGYNCSEVMEKISTKICDVFQEFKYLKDAMSNQLAQKKNAPMMDIMIKQNLDLFDKFYSRRINPRDAIKGINFLTELLYRHFRKYVFLLIDDWDELYGNILLQQKYQDVQEYNVGPGEKKCTEDVVQEFINVTIKNNPHVYQSVLTGTLRVKGLLDFAYEYYGYTSPYYKYYSFTDSEVNAIFDHLNISQKLRDKARDWYGGYKLNVTSNYCLYNPNSIANYACDKRIFNYRLRDNSSVNSRLLRIAADDFTTLKDGFSNLINDRVINIRVKALWDNKIFFSWSHLSNYFDDIGFFRLVRNLGVNGLDLQFANQEVRNELLTLMMNSFQKLYHIDDSLLKKATSLFFDYLFSNDTATEESFSTYFQPFITVFFTEQRFRYVIQYMTSQIALTHEQIRSHQPELLQTDRRYVLLPDDILYTDTKIAVIRVEMCANSTQYAIDQAKSFKHLLPQNRSFEVIKFIGINVEKDKMYIQSEYEFLSENYQSPTIALPTQSIS